MLPTVQSTQSQSYLIMEQHVQPLPVAFDLSGDVLVLQDHALSSTLAPLCDCREKNILLSLVGCVNEIPFLCFCKHMSKPHGGA